MNDDFDRASDLEQTDRDLAIERVRSQSRIFEHTGFCLNCREPSKKRFCNIDCRNDYEKRQNDR
jgi:hypothetical protein